MLAFYLMPSANSTGTVSVRSRCFVVGTARSQFTFQYNIEINVSVAVDQVYQSDYRRHGRPEN